MDSEIRAFVRYRNAILDPGVDLKLGGGDVNTSNTLLKYNAQDLDDALDVIRLLRKITVQHVSGLTEEEMAGCGYALGTVAIADEPAGASWTVTAAPRDSSRPCAFTAPAMISNAYSR